MIACKTLLQRTDNGDSACNSCFEKEIHMGDLCCVHKLFSVGGDQILVCCYHMLACMKSVQDISTCGLNSADQLNHNVNRRILLDLFPAVCKHCRIVYLRSCLFQISNQDLTDLDLAADLGCHLLFLAFQNLVNSGSNCSKPQKGRFYHFFFHGELPSLYRIL